MQHKEAEPQALQNQKSSALYPVGTDENLALKTGELDYEVTEKRLSVVKSSLVNVLKTEEIDDDITIRLPKAKARGRLATTQPTKIVKRAVKRSSITLPSLPRVNWRSKWRKSTTDLPHTLKENPHKVVLVGVEKQISQKIEVVRAGVARVVNNTIISLLGQAITWISTLLLTMAYGRYLGEVKFGELYLALNLITLISSPLEYSFNQQITRDVALEQRKALSYFSNVFVLKMLLWLILYAVALVGCRLLGYSPEEQFLVTIAGLMLLGTALTSIVKSVYYAFEKTNVPVLGNILEKGLSTVFGVVFLMKGGGVQVVALILMGSAFANAIWQTVSLLRLLGTRFSLDLKLMSQLTRTSIPFLIYGMLLVIYGRIDTFLLSLMTTTAVVGWYGAAYRLFDTLLFLPALIVTPIMYPIFSKLSVTSEKSLKLALEKCINFLLVVSIPISAGLIVAAPNIISFLYQRPEFSHSVPALQMLAPGIVVLYLNTVLTSTIISMKQERKIMIMAAIALVFNVGLNLVLIPRYAQVGTALMTTLTEVLLLGLALVFIPRRLLSFKCLIVAGKCLVASLVMVLAILPLHSMHIIVIVLVAGPVYIGGIALLRTIPREDLQALYQSRLKKKARS